MVPQPKSFRIRNDNNNRKIDEKLNGFKICTYKEKKTKFETSQHTRVYCDIFKLKQLNHLMFNSMKWM